MALDLWLVIFTPLPLKIKQPQYRTKPTNSKLLCSAVRVDTAGIVYAGSKPSFICQFCCLIPSYLLQRRRYSKQYAFFFLNFHSQVWSRLCLSVFTQISKQAFVPRGKMWFQPLIWAACLTWLRAVTEASMEYVILNVLCCIISGSEEPVLSGPSS